MHVYFRARRKMSMWKTARDKTTERSDIIRVPSNSIRSSLRTVLGVSSMPLSVRRIACLPYDDKVDDDDKFIWLRRSLCMCANYRLLFSFHRLTNEYVPRQKIPTDPNESHWNWINRQNNEKKENSLWFEICQLSRMFSILFASLMRVVDCACACLFLFSVCHSSILINRSYTLLEFLSATDLKCSEAVCHARAEKSPNSSRALLTVCTSIWLCHHRFYAHAYCIHCRWLWKSFVDILFVALRQTLRTRRNKEKIVVRNTIVHKPFS